MRKAGFIVIYFIALQFVNAQEVEVTQQPTSNWPFYFTDFVNATIELNGEKEQVTKTSININLFTGELQYLDETKTIRILQNVEDVKRIVVNEALQFIFVDNFVQKITAETDHYKITRKEKGSLSDLQESTGAYGSSTNTAAVDKIHDKLIGGINNFHYATLVSDKSGTSFKPEVDYFLIGEGFVEKLNKRNVLKHFEGHEDQIERFLKKEKIKFKDEQQYATFLNFLETL